MGFKFAHFGESEEKYERWMLRPSRKSIPTETRHPVQRMRRYTKKCALQSLARKVKNKTEKNNPIKHYISSFCPTNPAGPICTIFGTSGQTADVIIHVKF